MNTVVMELQKEAISIMFLSISLSILPPLLPTAQGIRKMLAGQTTGD